MTEILIFILGLGTYSFVEYGTHRWLLHGPLISLHAEHPRSPKKHINTSPWLLISTFLIGLLINVWFTAGFFIGWILSSLSHWNIHHGKSKLKEFHMTHHKNPRFNYGVTSGIWDRLLGTKL